MPNPRSTNLKCTATNSLGQRCARYATRGELCGWHDPNRERCQGVVKEESGGVHQCERPPMVGSNVCSVHGGATPDMYRVAKLQLLSLVEPALQTLQGAMEFGDWPAAVRAAAIILDRAGFGPHSTLHVDDPAMRDIAKLMPEQRISEMEQIVTLIRERALVRAAQAIEQKANVDEPKGVM